VIAGRGSPHDDVAWLGATRLPVQRFAPNRNTAGISRHRTIGAPKPARSCPGTVKRAPGSPDH
jgi:hypothetical protein